MQKVCVYQNTHASSASRSIWRERLTKQLFRSDLIFRDPKNLADLYDQLHRDIEDGIDALVSIGGDGTVNTLIQALAFKKLSLLVIPGGTANDLASELGNKKDLKRVIQLIRTNSYKEIDLIKVNDRYMATNGGIGLGGPVAQAINQVRKKFPLFKHLMKITGNKIYSLFVARELILQSFSHYHLLVEAREFTKEVNAVALLVNNQPVLAGTFNIAPETKNDDGLFNVTILTHHNFFSLVKCIIRIVKGDLPTDDPDFITFETDHLHMKSLNGDAVDFFGDGEIFDKTNEWDVTIEKRALRVFAKKGSLDFSDFVREVTLE